MYIQDIEPRSNEEREAFLISALFAYVAPSRLIFFYEVTGTLLEAISKMVNKVHKVIFSGGILDSS